MIAQEDAFEPPRPHVAVRVVERSFGRQLVQDLLAETQNVLREIPAFDPEPWRESIFTS